MGEALQVIRASEVGERALQVLDYPLEFPRHWRAHPVQNRYAELLERETLRWLRSHGIGTNDEEVEKLRMFECGKYGGCALPLANYGSALLVTRFISLWLFWDDMQVEEETGLPAAAVVDALTGEGRGTASENRYLSAWRDLGVQLRAARSASWRRRLGASMQQWIENARVETKLAKQRMLGGAHPGFDHLLACRTVGIGMFPTVLLLELCEDIELDAKVHEHASVVRLKVLASHLVVMGNDLQGLAKDIRHDWLNLVLELAAQHGLSIEHAFERLVSLHNRVVLAFDAAADAAPSFGRDTDVLLRGWIQAVRHNIYGFVLWESSAERYQRDQVVVNGRLLRASINELGADGQVPLVDPLLIARANSHAARRQ